MQRLILFVKGLLMGFADVVPGVSGGTIAFVTGIYPAFMAALSSVNFHWAHHLVRYLFSGFNSKHLEEAKHHFLRIHWGVLLTLLGGMLSAIVIGSSIVPGLMEAYPTQMRALFMGLVLASIAVPFAALNTLTPRLWALMVVASIGIYFMLGLKGEPPASWTTASAAQDQTLRDFSRQHPNLREPSGIYCPRTGGERGDNAALRQSVGDRDPVLAARLNALCDDLRDHSDDPQALATLAHEEGLAHSSTDPFAQLEVLAGTEIMIATPAYAFVFLSGAVAICAMVLPGISGSFILLILGVYTFVFTAVRGSVQVLLGRGDGLEPVLFLFIFALGILLGIMSFSRILTRLFERHREVTLVTLIGVMIGSLRAVWPFQVGSHDSGGAKNVLPTGDDPVLLILALVAVGFFVVLGLSKLSQRLETRLAAQASSSDST